MFKVFEISDNGFIVQDIENDELITLKTENEMQNFFEDNMYEISSEFLTNMIKNLHNDNVSADIFSKVLHSSIDVFENKLPQKELINLAKTKQENFDYKLTTKIMYSLKSDLGAEFYNECKDKFSKEQQIQMVCTIMDDKTTLDFLGQNVDIENEEKKKLLYALSSKELLNAYKSNKYNSQNLIPIEDVVFSIKEKKQIKRFTSNHLQKFSIDVLGKIDNESIQLKEIVLSVLEKNSNSLDENQLLFLIANSSSKKQEEYYKKFENKFDDIQKCTALLCIKETTQNQDFIDSNLQALQLTDKTKTLIQKVTKNFGVVELSNGNAKQFIKQSQNVSLHEDTLYQLFKYCVYTNTMPDISNAVEQQDIFKAFEEFRKQNIEQNNMDVINIRDTLTDFNTHHNLIKDCMEAPMTKQEQDKFVSVLNDRFVQIESRGELKDYPRKRSEFIDNLIQTDIESSITYILTGLNKEEYKREEKLFFNDKQLKITSSEFSEELKDNIMLMQISKEIISIIQNETEENKIKILRNLKNDLEKEFSPQGSQVAKLRKNFRGFQTSLKSLYGRELQESLTNTQFPKSKKIKGVETIKLNGERFKMLIHGLNAYGQGKAAYQHSDVGAAYICTSLISDNNMGRADAAKYYGFKNISDKSLALEGPTDIWSDAKENSLDITSNRNLKFLKTDKLLEQTDLGEYNEIVLFRDQEDKLGNVHPIKPDYIVAFNKISHSNREEAKRLKIPIVLINEKAYEKQEEKNEESVTEQEVVVENKQDEKKSKEFLELRERMMDVIINAKNNCSAIQQEAIMQEMQKEFKLSKQQSQEQAQEQGEEKKEDLSV